MIRRLCSLVSLLLLGPFTSCNKPGPEANRAPAQSASAASAPVPVVTSSGVEMVYLPGGGYLMGTDKGNADEAPPHQVTVSPFFIDKFEVTHAMFTKVQLPNPSHWQDHPQKPVERVRWRDAKQYCNERSLLENLTPC